MSYGHTFGLDVTCLRPFNNYGPRQNSAAFAGIIPLVINHVRRNEPVLIFGDGQQTRDYIHVRDTARAAVMMYENEGARDKVINVGSGAELSVESLVRAILEEKDAADHPVEYLPARPGDVRRHMAGTQRARELLGFEPQIDLEEGLAETVKWYLDQGEQAS
jgi:UDP-glucose 4-epimerase